MLWDISAINGYAINASDGQLGTVSDLLFDDVRWIIRWLVVDTGIWLPGRKVLLPVSALCKPDAALRRFHVKLNKQQVKDSPDIITDQPVSRQVEVHVYNYYGWDPYWGDSIFNLNAMATPLVRPPLSTPRDIVGTDADLNKGDPHLCSIAAVTGYHIHAIDGEIDHVEGFLVDDVGWNVRYFIVDTKNWWPGKRVLISPHSVRTIDWIDGLVHLDINRQIVRGSPPYDPSIALDRAYEDRYRMYYGTKWVAG